MVLFCFWLVQQMVCAGMFLADFDSLFVSVAVTVHRYLETFLILLSWNTLVCDAFSPLGPWTSVPKLQTKWWKMSHFIWRWKIKEAARGTWLVCAKIMEGNGIHVAGVWTETDEAIRLIPLLFPRKESHHAELKLGLQPAHEISTWTAEFQCSGSHFPKYVLA